MGFRNALGILQYRPTCSISDVMYAIQIFATCLIMMIVDWEIIILSQEIWLQYQVMAPAICLLI
jgi:hypothetical protein